MEKELCIRIVNSLLEISNDLISDLSGLDPELDIVHKTIEKG